MDDEEKWAWLRHDESETDDRSILEVYREEGYTDAYYILAFVYDEDDERRIPSAKPICRTTER
ncbi:MAG: hypothetical protein ACLUN5_02625 [Oscillospiraceae bacterium]